METVYALHIDITPVPPEVIAEKEKQMGYFVLATGLELKNKYRQKKCFANTKSRVA